MPFLSVVLPTIQEILPFILNYCDKNNIPATFFEITTALAFLQFSKSSCDAIVLEVGLGGRLDSTNVVTPSLSVITSVQLDHCNILGNTISEIAKEKAGIMKKGIDVLVAPGCPMDVMQVIMISVFINIIWFICIYIICMFTLSMFTLNSYSYILDGSTENWSKNVYH